MVVIPLVPTRILVQAITLVHFRRREGGQIPLRTEVTPPNTCLVLNLEHFISKVGRFIHKFLATVRSITLCTRPRSVTTTIIAVNLQAMQPFLEQISTLVTNQIEETDIFQT